MSSDEYTPTVEEVRTDYAYNADDTSYDEARARFDRMIARVRREAAAELMHDGFCDWDDWTLHGARDREEYADAVRGYLQAAIAAVTKGCSDE